MPASKNISFDELAKYFHLPINQVAKELGVCATILKKICRKNGIPRWPHRKIKSLDKMISNLEVNLSKNPNEKEEISNEMELLKSKKEEIMKNPDILVSNSHRAKHGAVHANMKKNKPRLNQAQPMFMKDILSLANDEGSSFMEETFSPSPFRRPEINNLRNLEESIPTSLASLRRASLPILDNYQIPHGPTSINLPPPIRRHSVDSLLLPQRPMHNDLFPSFVSPQEKPFSSFNNFPIPPMNPVVLPGIDTPVNPRKELSEVQLNLPDWFEEERKRVLGH